MLFACVGAVQLLLSILRGDTYVVGCYVSFVAAVVFFLMFFSKSHPVQSELNSRFCCQVNRQCRVVGTTSNYVY